jgi:hypothetical protein
MPWPESLAPLLACPNSRAAQALRWGLYGLRASLQAVLEEVPHDPGGPQLRTLLAELDPLLATTLPQDAPVAAHVEAPSDCALRLLPLARAIVEDGRFQAELRRSPLREASDETIWNDVQRLLLRVPAYLAGEWRRRSIQMAEQVGARADQTAALVLPLLRDEVIYPGLTGTIHATGMCAKATAPPDPRVPRPALDDLRFLAGVVTTCLWLVEQEPGLCHGLRSVFQFGLAPLVGEQRERYVAELLRRWERARTSATPRDHASRPQWREELKALLDLDEALHSLVYQPPVAPDSWWGRLQNQARDVLFRVRDQAVQADCAAHLQLLGGSFADINRLAPDSLQVDFGVSGEVSVCLRVWARIDGEELKGRTLYRSPQEDS